MRELGPALFLLRARRGTVPGLPALPGEIASAVLAITRGGRVLHVRGARARR